MHRFVVVWRVHLPPRVEQWFDDVRTAFAHADGGIVYVTLEETGSRYRVLRP